MFRIPAYIHRHPNSGIFYFRLTVPQHLRHIVGKREIQRSLRTGLRTVATPLAQRLYVDTRRIFFEAEQRMVKHRGNYVIPSPRKNVLEHGQQRPPRKIRQSTSC